MAHLFYIAAAIIGLLAVLFMFGAAKVASDADRQSERLWRLLSAGRSPWENSR